MPKGISWFNFGIQANGVNNIIDAFAPYWQLVRFENGQLCYCEDGQIMILPPIAAKEGAKRGSGNKVNHVANSGSFKAKE